MINPERFWPGSTGIMDGNRNRKHGHDDVYPAWLLLDDRMTVGVQTRWGNHLIVPRRAKKRSWRLIRLLLP
jgi:hypothetical protein